MRNHPMILLAASTVLLGGSLAWAAGETTQQESQAEYSADSYTESAEVTLKEHVYVAPGKQRKESAMGDSTPVTIIRMDKGVMWMLMPDDKMYMEMSLQQAQSRNPGVDTSGYQMEKTEMGREVVNGHEAIKYKVIMTDAKGNKLGGFQWVVSPGIQIKLDAVSKEKNSKERIKMELTNLKIGKQDPALFEIPDGYTKMVMPSIPGMGDRGMKGLLDRLPKRPGQ
jgi:outer membrane lipoprotein-sorting protein